MPFIQPHEYIILMDWPTGALSSADLKAIRSVGVETAYVFVYWGQVEAKPDVYNWTVPDYSMNRLAQAGLKVLLLCPANGVSWGPDHWYARMPDGRLWRNFYDGYRDDFGYNIISPWSTDGLAHERAFMRACRERYTSATVQCVAGGVHGGEVILPGMVESWHDAAALASFRDFAGQADAVPATIRSRGDMTLPENRLTLDWLSASLCDYVLEHQRVMVEGSAHREVWLMLPQRNTEYAELVETGPRSGNWLAPALYAILPYKFDASLNILLFEAYRAGGDQGIFEGVKGFESVTWVGSQYCEGLRTNTARAIAQGLRGFLTGPMHPDGGQHGLTPDMLAAFEWSLAQWREARS